MSNTGGPPSPPPDAKGGGTGTGTEFRLNVEGAGETEVLEATAAPRQQGFARPTRRGRGRAPGRSTSASGSGSGSGPRSPLLSPIPGAGTQSRGNSPSPIRSGSGSRSRDVSPSPSSLSSRSQSMLRAPHPYDDESVGVSFSGESGSGSGGRGGEGDDDNEEEEEVLSRFVEMQRLHDEETRKYEEEIRELRHEVRKLAGQAHDQEDWIRHVETRCEEEEGKNKQLQRENGILMAQLASKDKEVRVLTQEVKSVEKVIIYEPDSSGKTMTPVQANSRLKQLREEIAALKEERDRNGEELEALWEKKSLADELQRENEELKKEIGGLRKGLEVLEAKLEVEREAVKRYEEPAEKRLERVQTMTDTQTNTNRESVVLDVPENSARIEELLGIIEDLKIKHEKEEEQLRIKIQEAEATIQEKNELIHEIHIGANWFKERVPELEEQIRLLKEQAAQVKERHEGQLKELRDEIGEIEEKLGLKEEALAQEKERHEARENIWKSDERELRAQLEQLERSDVKEVEELKKDLQEKEEEVALLKGEKEKVDQKVDDLSTHNKHLQQTVKTYRKAGADLPIRQTIANTQLWAEKNILKNSLENVKNRIKEADPDQLQEAVKLIEDTKHELEKSLSGDKGKSLAQKLSAVQEALQGQVKPLKAISDELKQNKDRLNKEKEDFAKDDGEMTAILRRIEGRGSDEKHHRKRASRRLSHLMPDATKSDFMRRIEQLEDEQNKYITTRHEEYTAMNAERPLLGAPLTPEEDKRLHELTLQFVEKLPENPIVAFLGGETPQARRRNQLWALTEKVKRLKIREAGKDIHTWLPKIKPIILEHKRRHAQLVRELQGLEGQAEDLVQEINQLLQPPDLIPRGRSPVPKGSGDLVEQEEQPSAVDQEKIRKQEEELRKKEEQLRREIRFAYSRLERLLYNRQLFEHWVENIEKRLNNEAAGLVTQVLLEFELRNLLDKESKEACFCSLLEYFFPKVYDATVRGGPGHGHAHSHGQDLVKEKETPGGKTPATGRMGKSPIPRQPGSANLLGRAETIDLRGSYRGKRRDRGKTMGRSIGQSPSPAVILGDDEVDVAVRSMAPRRPARVSDVLGDSPLRRPTSYYGEGTPGSVNPDTAGLTARMAAFNDTDFPRGEDTASGGSSSSKHAHHGHGGNHLTISPQSAHFFRDHAYPYLCQVLTSLLWFVLLIAIQPVNMFRTFSFMFAFVFGLPVYLVQFTRFYLSQSGGLLSPRLASRFQALKRNLMHPGAKKESKTEVERVDLKPAPGVGTSAGTGAGTVTGEYVNLFETNPVGGPGLGIVVPKPEEGETSSSKEKEKEEPTKAEQLPSPAPSPELQLRGGGGRQRKSKWELKREYYMPEDIEPESGSEGEAAPELVTESDYLKGEDKGKGKEKENAPGSDFTSHQQQSERKKPPTEIGGTRKKSEERPKEEEVVDYRAIRFAKRSIWDSLLGSIPLDWPFSSWWAKVRTDTNTALVNPWLLAPGDDDKPQAEGVKVKTETAPFGPPFWRRWWASLRTLFDLVFVKMIPLLLVTIRTLFNTGLSKLGSLFSQLANVLTRIFSSSSNFLTRISHSSITSIKRIFYSSSNFLTRIFYSSINALTRISHSIINFINRVSSSILNFSKQTFSSILNLLQKASGYPVKLSKNIWTRLPEANIKKSLHIPRINNLRLNKLRPPKINLPKVPKVPTKINNINIKSKLPNRPRIPQLPTVSRLPKLPKFKFNIKFPTLSNIPKLTPPRPPSPPTILGSLLSLFVIYTILTYLACVQERRIWTSSNTAWKHAYLRDLELSNIAAVSRANVDNYIQSQNQWYSQSSPLGHTIRSALTSPFRASSSSSTPSVVDLNSAYPGWSPAKVDYRLVYAPLWWRIWYAPGDLASWGGEKLNKIWDGVVGICKAGVGGTVDAIGERINVVKEWIAETIYGGFWDWVWGLKVRLSRFRYRLGHWVDSLKDLRHISFRGILPSLRNKFEDVKYDLGFKFQDIRYDLGVKFRDIKYDLRLKLEDWKTDITSYFQFTPWSRSWSWSWYEDLKTKFGLEGGGSIQQFIRSKLYTTWRYLKRKIFGYYYESEGFGRKYSPGIFGRFWQNMRWKWRGFIRKYEGEEEGIRLIFFTVLRWIDRKVGAFFKPVWDVWYGFWWLLDEIRYPRGWFWGKRYPALAGRSWFEDWLTD